MIMEALDAQKVLYGRRRKPNFIIQQHGSKIMVQRSNPEGVSLNLTGPPWLTNP